MTDATLNAPTSKTGAPRASEARSEGRPVLAPAALYGLAGRVVNAIAPETEADPVALLMSFLTVFGVAVGPGPHTIVGATTHTPRLFAVLVGDTAKARKGTAGSEIARLFASADPDFVTSRMRQGFASGEAIVSTVATAGEDPRLLVTETEFARLLNSARQVRSLSTVLRQAWDGEARLSVITKTGTLVAEGAHIALIGHITDEELRARLTGTEVASGFANRFLFALVHRSQLLPTGGNLDVADVVHLGKELSDVLAAASHIGLVRRTPDAAGLWRQIYDDIAKDEPPGIIGALVARDDAQLLRLQLLYALLDGSDVIDVPHVEAAWAVRDYCRQSVEVIFGSTLGDDVADRLFIALKRVAPEGLTGAQQYMVFGKHIHKNRLQDAVKLLKRLTFAREERKATAGRTATELFYTTPKEEEVRREEEWARRRQEDQRQTAKQEREREEDNARWRAQHPHGAGR